MPPDSAHLGQQIVWLVVLAIPISSIVWTVTHEEVFREPREYCKRKSEMCASLLKRKFFYLFTCEYCFSHYVTALALVFTRFKLLLDDWRGYVVALFALVWVANAYMSLFGRLRVEIRSERAAADVKAREVKVKEKEIEHLETRLAGTRDDRNDAAA
ncbi:MAG TPA: hypothetical protein VLI90_18160 [Tepidisphaeraceae bacterium]|nr:hypothetical protein [Tepidisphaeraceae bacterium]